MLRPLAISWNVSNRAANSLPKIGMNKRVIIIFGILGILLLSSCKTYHLPLESFKNQFKNLDSTDLRMVSIYGAVNGSYLANPIEGIKCLDKKGNSIELVNSPSIEIRFTHGQKNKKTIMYFDRILLDDSIIYGAQSRIIPSMINSVQLNQVSEIEIQDGHKNYHYVENQN